MTVQVQPLVNREEGVVCLEKWWGRGNGVVIQITLHPRKYEVFIITGHRVVQHSVHRTLKEAVEEAGRLGYQITVSKETLEMIRRELHGDRP